LSAKAEPQSLNVYLTSRCNQRCPFCRRQKNNGMDTLAKKDFTPALAEEILKRFPSIQTVCIAGFGEPLLSPELYPIIGIFKRTGRKVEVITNGVLLKEHASRLIDAKVDFLSVSVNAADQTERLAVTGTDSWGSLISGLRDVLGSGMTVATSFVISKQNWIRIPQYAQAMQAIGVRFVDFHNTLPHSEHPDDLYQFESETILDTDANVIQALTLFRKNPFSAVVRNWPTPTPTVAPQNSKCRSPFFTLGVDGDGNCTACSRIYGPGTMPANLSDPGFWSGNAFERFRKALMGQAERPTLCAKCWGNLK